MRFGVALICMMVVASGCGPSEREKLEATEKSLSAWDKETNQSRAEYIRVLISEGAEVNARDTDDLTPLMYAARYSTPEIVQLLLEKGAEVNARTTGGMTPLMYAAININGKSAEIKQLLIDAGAKE